MSMVAGRVPGGRVRLGGAVRALIATVLLVLPLAACGVNGSVVATEQERRTIPTDDAPFVLVETFNGRISVQGTADPVVEVRITRRGSGTSQERADRDRRGRTKKAEKLQARQDKSLQRKAEQDALATPPKTPEQV